MSTLPLNFKLSPALVGLPDSWSRIRPDFFMLDSYPGKLVLLAMACLLLSGASARVSAQSLERVLGTPQKVEVTIRNRNGRVTVTAADEEQKGVSVKATSPGATVEEKDILTTSKGGIVT